MYTKTFLSEAFLFLKRDQYIGTFYDPPEVSLDFIFNCNENVAKSSGKNLYLVKKISSCCT